MTMGHREPIKSGAEAAVVTGWRRVLCYTSRAGVCRRIKTVLAKRTRKAARQALRQRETPVVRQREICHVVLSCGRHGDLRRSVCAPGTDPVRDHS